jgi:SWI/SNF-related matrix-associated actin-dependent regulator 1 of chromatin subfamily A
MSISAARPDPSCPWVVSAPFSRKYIAICKTTPGIAYDPTIKKWGGSLDAVAALFGRLKSAGFTTVQPIKVRLPKIAVPRSASRQYQLEGIKFILQHAQDGCLLADVMGLGKTKQSIDAAYLSYANNILIICPNAVKLHWAADLKKWLRGMAINVRLLEKTKSKQMRDLYTNVKTRCFDQLSATVDLSKPTFWICNYDILHAWLKDLPPIDFVIIDEAHCLISPKSRRSKAVRAICLKTPRRVALTGTPLANYPRNMWNLIDTIRPGSVGPFFKFALRYCGAYQETIEKAGDVRVVWNFDGRSHEKELHRRLSFFMLRRTVEEVKMELPPKTRQVIELDVSKQYCVGYDVRMLKDRKAVRAMLDIAADGKLPISTEFAIEHARAGHKVVVFTWRRATAHSIADAAAAVGIRAGIITGGVSIDKRQAIVSSKPDILCCTIDTCSTGIDLTYADVALYAELSYQPYALIQSEARLWRFGQERHVLIQYLIARNTIDELIASAVISKIDTFEAVIGNTGDAANLRDDLESRGQADPLAALVAAFQEAV